MNIKVLAIALPLLLLNGMNWASSEENCGKWTKGNTILEIKPFWEKVSPEYVIE